MPPFDSKAALKNAEKAIKQGRVDLAIAEYVKVVEAQPRDWNSANALGDLYVRANQIEKGVQQYTRIADHLAEEGFYPKAAALYKKILKIKPDDEYSHGPVRRHGREVGHAGRRQAVLHPGGRTPQEARRQEGRHRNRHSPRHARSRGLRGAHARREARHRIRRHDHGAARVQGRGRQAREEGTLRRRARSAEGGVRSR